MILIMNNDSVEIQNSETLGKGLFSKKKFETGDIIFSLSGDKLSSPTRESIYVGNGIHIDDHYGAYINHSFKPSTIINGFDVVAIKEIFVGDEITFDYNRSELNMANPFYVDGIFVTGNDNNK